MVLRSREGLPPIQGVYGRALVSAHGICVAMTSLRAFVRHGDSSFRRFFLTSDAPLQPLKPRPQRSPISTLTHAACEGVRAHECDSREISSGSRPTSLRKKGTEVGPRFGFALPEISRDPTAARCRFFQGRRLVAHRSQISKRGYRTSKTGIQIKGTMFPIASCRQAKVDDVGGRL